MGERIGRSFLVTIQDVATLLHQEAKKQEKLSSKHIKRISKSQEDTLARAVDRIAELLRNRAKKISRIAKKSHKRIV